MKPKTLDCIIKCTKEEEEFRKEAFSDVSKVMDSRLVCTCCLRNVKNDIMIKHKAYIHPFLRVLVCKDCLKFYGDGYISPDDDGSDKYCRWCGQGGCLYVCSQCPVAICKTCIKRNFSRAYVSVVEKDSWRCFSCEPKPLFNLRAQAWALKTWLESYRKKSKKIVEEVKAPVVDTLEGHLKNGIDYGVAVAKEVQKTCRSAEMKLGGLIRRKEVVNKQDLSMQKVQEIFEEISNHMKATINSISKNQQDLQQYIDELGPVIEKLKDQQSTEKPLQESTNKKRVLNKSNDSVEEEIESKKQKNNVVEEEDKSDMISGGDAVSDRDQTNDSTEVCNNVDMTEESSAQNFEGGNSECAGEEDVKPPIPKLTLRVRKIEEVNEVLQKENLQEKEEGMEYEVICLDDEPSDKENSVEMLETDNPNTKSDQEDEEMSEIRKYSSRKSELSHKNKKGTTKSSSSKSGEGNVKNIDESEDHHNQSKARRNDKGKSEENQVEREDDKSKGSRSRKGKREEVVNKKMEESEDEVSNVSKTGRSKRGEKTVNQGKRIVEESENQDDNEEKKSRGYRTSKNKSKKKSEKQEGSEDESSRGSESLRSKTVEESERQEENEEEKSERSRLHKDKRGEEVNKNMEESEDEVSSVSKSHRSKKEEKIVNKGKRVVEESESQDENEEEKSGGSRTRKNKSEVESEKQEGSQDERSKEPETSHIKKEKVKINSMDVEAAKEDALSNHSSDIFSDDDVVVTRVDSSSNSDSNSSESSNNKSKGKAGTSKRKKTVASGISDSSDSDFEKLLNVRNLESKKNSSREKVKIKKEKETKVKEEKDIKSKKSKTIVDFCDEDSDASVIDDLPAEVNVILKLDEKLDCDTLTKMIMSGKYFRGPIKQENRTSHLSDLDDAMGSCVSSDTDFDDILRDSDDDRKPKIKSKKNKNSSDQDSSDSDVESKSKSKWKKDKLLTENHSSSVSDSDDSVFKKKQEKKKSSRLKGKTVILSDSDENGKQRKKQETIDLSESDSSIDNTPKKRRRIKKAASSSDDENAVEGSGGKGHRKNIKKILKKDSLQESTQNALKEEEERKKRIAERQKLYNLMIEAADVQSSKVDKLVLDFDPESKKELLSVDPDLVAKLKPHQAEGIKFMWDSCFETVKKALKTKGSGCILAHCMGLGKTLQVVTLLHTLLTNEVGIKTALVLCPLSTVLNWVNEFDKWLSDIGSGEDVNVFHMAKATAQYRADQLRQWQRQGGVMVLAYNLFRILVNPAKRTKASLRKVYLESLTDPGPDIVICDEGHLLKNEKTSLSKSVEKFSTLRRVVLTGTPLQNNLQEYHCMMQFVKPNLLGTKKEFTNRFVNPIENGQFVDSTPQDVKVMKRRAHVLHRMLDGIVQRKDYNVLVPFLPYKHEYVLSLSLTEVQIKLYQYYLDHLARNKSTTGAGVSLFKDRNTLGLICSHPRLLMVQNDNEMMKKEMESDSEGSLKDFIDDSTSSSSSSESESDNSNSNSSAESNKMVSKRSTRRAPQEPLVEPDTADAHPDTNQTWWGGLIDDSELEDIGASTKLHLFFTILHKCEEIGDKLLLFSQSLYSLDLIEYFLDKIDNATVQIKDDAESSLPLELRGFTGSWHRGIDYFRLDGKTSSENRSNWCNRFNAKDNMRARLFLISTRAGGLGINLTGANRVILYDASWNPSHDVQSIFRVYRFGQGKPCYIYRFLNKGTMEQKVYDRQVAKLSMSLRVIDEQQIDRHFSYADLNELYTFSPNEKDDKTPPLPKDRLLAELLQEHKDIVISYHTHDSLLENQEDEELNEEERKQAWADFENEKKPQPQNFMMNNYTEAFQRAYKMLKETYPLWTEQQVRSAAMSVLQRMTTMTQSQPSPQMYYQGQPMQFGTNLPGQQVGSNVQYRVLNPAAKPAYLPKVQPVNTANNRIINYQQPAYVPNPMASALPNPFHTSRQQSIMENLFNSPANPQPGPSQGSEQ